MQNGMLAALFILSVQGQTVSEAAISGPYDHDNLSIFLIHRAALYSRAQRAVKPSASRHLTLQQGMDQKVVLVNETNQVSELAVENVSANPVFIQEGDIVKGGKQDRMITNDFILPSKSGKIPLSAFCVEQGRWGQRGTESAKAFSGSTELAAVRFDPKAMWNQSSVWQHVLGLQEALASRLRHTNVAGVAAVRAPASPTSLMLTQTSPSVEEAVAAYTKTLSGIAAGNPDAIGYAFAINGEVRGADLYASPSLFLLMWPKLLKSSAVEAVRLHQRIRTTVTGRSQVATFLRDSNLGTPTTKSVGGTNIVAWDGRTELTVECRDGNDWVHRSIVMK